MTLLSNIEHFRLFRKWKPNYATDGLIHFVVRKAKRSQNPGDESSLARVSKLNLLISLVFQDHCHLNFASHFFALPRIQHFRARSCVAITAHTGLAFKIPYAGFTISLEMVDFVDCCIDPTNMAKFLKHSPCLKRLRYSHSPKENNDDHSWNICDFVTIIEREAGSYLEGLSLSLSSFRDSIVPGRVSLSKFQRLQKLELPLESTMYSCDEMNYNESFIDERIPASVSQLSLISDGTNGHARILDVIFRDFAVRKTEKRPILPALERIVLTCPSIESDAYKEQCASLLAETEKAGIALELRSYLSSSTLTWDKQE